MPGKVPVPSPGPKPQICLWLDFSLKNIDELKLLQEPDAARRKISEILSLNGNNDPSREMILTDLFYFAYIFATDCKFNEEQISAFLSMIKRTHEKSMESPYGNIEESYEYFKELLLRHCVKVLENIALNVRSRKTTTRTFFVIILRPPFSIQLYSMSEARKITDYVVETYFKHFKLYKYAFTPKVRLDLTFEYKGLPEEIEDSLDNKEDTAAPTDLNIEEENDGEAEKDEYLEEEEPAAVKELKAMINSTLSDQVHKLKLNVDQQLKANEEAILKKMSEATGGERVSSRRSRKK